MFGWQSADSLINRPCRFLFVLNDLRIGGAERQALLLARQLKLRGHHPTILGLASPGPVIEICREWGIECHLEQFQDPEKNPFEPQHGDHYVNKMQRLLQRYRSDILMPFTSLPNVYCGIAWRWSTARICVWNQRDSGLDRMPEPLEQQAVSSCSGFIANSRSGADFLIQTLRIPAPLVKVCQNGIEPVERLSREAARIAFDLRRDDFAGVMLGNVRLIKDHETLVRAWERVVERWSGSGGRPVLLLAGHVQPECESLRTRIESGPLSEYIRFVGYRSDVSTLLSAADIGVFSSHSEGLPNGVLECMAAALPMVATDLPGIRECVLPLQYPFLVPPRQPELFAERILQLTDPDLRTTLGQENRRWVESHFSVETLATNTLTAIAEFEKSQRRGSRLGYVWHWLRGA